MLLEHKVAVIYGAGGPIGGAVVEQAGSWTRLLPEHVPELETTAPTPPPGTFRTGCSDEYQHRHRRHELETTASRLMESTSTDTWSNHKGCNTGLVVTHNGPCHRQLRSN